MHRIIIEKAVNGIIVKIGCATFVAEDVVKGMDWLATYLRDPEPTEKWWRGKYPELGLNNCPRPSEPPTMETATSRLTQLGRTPVGSERKEKKSLDTTESRQSD